MTRLPYYLPLTRVRVEGEVTTARVGAGQRQIIEGEVAVDLTVGADGNACRVLDPKSSGVADHEIAIGFTPDGRLLTTEGTATGKVGSIVTSLARFSVGLVGAIAPTVLSSGLGVPGLMSRTAGLEAEGEGAGVQPSRALELTEQAIDTLRERLALVDRGAGQGDASAAGAEATAIVAALARLEDQRTRLRAEFEAFQAEAGAARTTPVTLTVPLGDLPTHEYDGDALPELLEDVDPFSARLLALTGVAVCIRERPAKSVVEQPNGECHGIEYRVPRPAEMLVYRAASDMTGRSQQPRLEGVYPIVVFDNRSAVACIDLKNPVLSKDTVKATFGGAGHLESASTSASSPLDGIAEELGKLPETVSGALKTANAIVDEQQQLAAAPMQARIQDLEDRVKLAEQRRELIEADAALRDGRLVGELTNEAEILKLRNELDALRLTQLTNQRAIEELQEPDSD